MTLLLEYKVTKFFRFSKSSTPPNLFLRPVELASILFCYGRLWVYMVVHCCLWLFIAAMVALAAHVVHARSWLPWMSCRSCPFVVAMDVCGCHGRSGRSWLFMAVHGCHGCSLPPWLPWMVLAIPYILAVPQFPAISRPALRL